MTRKKKLVTTLSLPLFIALIISFTALQGFDTAGPTGGNIGVTLIGIDNSTCILYAENVLDASDHFYMYRKGSGKNGITESYYSQDGLVAGKKYKVSVCFQAEGGHVET